jgi:4-deoxy-L-threo-5-hexosulose-uronate ketol-isomerase
MSNDAGRRIAGGIAGEDGMDIRYLPDDRSYERWSTEEIRKSFLLEGLFVPGTVTMVYTDADRAIAGGAVPLARALPLEATKKEMAAEYFTERREVGVVNLGGDGIVRADGVDHVLRAKDMLYIGRGTREVLFLSAKSDAPAVFYFASYPAHASYPTTIAPYGNLDRSHLGAAATANERTINRYIHTGGVKSCQLVMGLTELASGSVWNTMPPHTHQRRMEVYLYCGLGPEDLVVHLMGRPDATRNILVRDMQAVISPPWSIHCAAGTRNYFFVWAMGGENQEFGDMDAVPVSAMK